MQVEAMGVSGATAPVLGVTKEKVVDASGRRVHVTPIKAMGCTYKILKGRRRRSQNWIYHGKVPKQWWPY